MFSWFRRRRRRKLLAEPFPPYWEAILKRNVGHFPRLSAAEQQAMRDILRVLVAEKEWEGVGGLFITDEHRVTIAAVAALMLLGGADHDYYDRVDSIVVYPGVFRTPNPEDGWEDDELSDNIIEGQAVYRGPVILSWQEVLRESRQPEAGYNVVIHEFAHQLDFLDNTINGTPPIDDPELAAKWGPVMTAAFQRHKKELAKGEAFFTEHAADDETEFFADASEAFFCQPHGLEEEYSDVFMLLKGYYRLDPRRWFGDNESRKSSR